MTEQPQRRVIERVFDAVAISIPPVYYIDVTSFVGTYLFVAVIADY